MNNKKPGRPRKYGSEMGLITAYVPQKIIELAEKLQKEKNLDSFNEGLNMVMLSVDKKFAENLTDRWCLAKEVIEQHKEEIQNLKDLMHPITLARQLDAGKEMDELIDEFIREKGIKEELTNRFSKMKISTKKHKLLEKNRDWIIQTKASQLVNVFKYWLAERNKMLQKPRAVELLIYQKLKT